MAETPQSDPQTWVDRMEKILALEEHPGWAVMMQMLALDAQTAVEELVNVDPRDGDAVAALQDRVKRYQWLGQTIENVITMGQTELANLEQQEAEESDGQEE